MSKPSPEEQYWNLRLAKAARAFAENNFGVSVHQTAAEAANYLVTTMLGPAWKGSVNFGGSASVLQSGVVDLLKAHPGAEVIPTYDASMDRETLMALRRKHFICDLYLASANAATMDGQLLNVDGSGNRVAAMIYGPDRVVLFVGRNKLCETLDAAYDRCRNIAAPMNAMRLNMPTPCVTMGKCMNCKSPQRICNYWTTIQRCMPAGRIHVLLVNEVMGF